jgi:hypothetical protein
VIYPCTLMILFADAYYIGMDFSKSPISVNTRYALIMHFSITKNTRTHIVSWKLTNDLWQEHQPDGNHLGTQLGKILGP